MISTLNDELKTETTSNPTAEIDTYLSFEAREVVYRFLAWLFLYPDTDRLQRLKAAAAELSHDDWWRDLPLTPSFERLFAILSAVDEAAAKDIVNEYNRLFLVKPQAPAHETFYLDGTGQFRGWMASKLEGIYAKNGLAISPTLNEMPDHLAVELEFMSHLCSITNTEDSEMIEAAIVSQRAFLTQHLAKWFPKFAKKVKEAEPQHHYGAAVEATFMFLRGELAVLVSYERSG